MDSYMPTTDSDTTQLDLLLAHLAKEFSSVIPIPDHLVDDFRRLQDEGLSVTDGKQTSFPPVTLVRESTNSTDAHNIVQEPATEQILCDKAFRACAKRVVGLKEWQICVEENLTRSEHSRQVLQYVLDIINSMRDVTKLIQNQSDFLSHNASVLLAGCAKLERVQAELQENLRHFSNIDNLNFEAKEETLSATSPRFFTLFQDLQSEIQFLYEHRSFKSALSYAAKLTEAQQRVLNCLKVVLENSFAAALQCALKSDVYKGLVIGISLPIDVGAHPPPLSSSMTSKILNISAEAEDMTLKDGADGIDSLHAEKTLEGQRSMSSTLSVPKPSALLSSNVSITPQGIVNALETGLRSINQLYLDSLNENALLRRMIETQKGFCYAGDQTFGGETLQRVETNFQLQEILKAYQESRIELVSPLLQQCLKLCCHVDTTDASSLLEETLQRLTFFETQPENSVSLSTAVPHDITKFNSKMVDGRHTLAQNVSVYSLPRLVSYICVLLQVIIPLERDVLESLWMRDDFIAWLFPKMVSEMVDGLYRQFRSRLLRVDSITELCYTVEYIQKILTHQSMENPQLRELSELWVSMVQDTQERIVFRAGDCLRKEIACDPPTKELAKRYALAGEEEKVTPGVTEPSPESLSKEMFYLPGMLQSLGLLNLLYPAIEFSVFSVFAEEIIDRCLKLVQGVGKPVHNYCVSAPADESLPSLRDWGEVKASLCQLAHLLYLRQELAQIDAKIAVVDKSLDFAKLATERKLEITQSSRESKTKVDAEVHTCATQVSRALQKTVAQPLTGATRMSAAAREKALENMEQAVTRAKQLLSWFISGDLILYERLLEGLEEGVRELREEVAELPPPSAP
ncbi:unnamed protein product [Phytomonas sp. EM1]|nr:unnamed protein product [Phytomonas sp. EM1]|eukprot:CCW60040.1 unnamed protein product [Phytomonas sp. isolate EM1]